MDLLPPVCRLALTGSKSTPTRRSPPATHAIRYSEVNVAQAAHLSFFNELQNLSKIGVASHEVGVAEIKVGGAAAPPTE